MTVMDEPSKMYLYLYVTQRKHLFKIMYDSNEFRLCLHVYVHNQTPCLSKCCKCVFMCFQHLVSLHKYTFGGKCCFTPLDTNQVISEFILIHEVK